MLASEWIHGAREPKLSEKGKEDLGAGRTGKVRGGGLKVTRGCVTEKAGDVGEVRWEGGDSGQSGFKEADASTSGSASLQVPPPTLCYAGGVALLPSF